MALWLIISTSYLLEHREGVILKNLKVIAIILVFGMILSSCSNSLQQNEKISFIAQGTNQSDMNLTDYKQMASTKELTLYMNPSTTDIKVIVNATGYEWNSENPMESASKGKSIIFNYYNERGAVQSMDTLADSVAKGQYEIKQISNGVSVHYSFGQIEGNYLCPMYLSLQRYKKFYNQADSKGKSTLGSMYMLLDFSTYSDADLEAIKKKYPDAGNENTYALRALDMSISNKIKLDETLRNAGYTEADLAIDSNSQTASNLVKPQYNITISYVLENDTMKVLIPENGIEFYKKYPLESLQILPFFGSATKETAANGYVFIPDGSGALMNMFQTTSSEAAVIPIYGQDFTVPQKQLYNKENQAIFPVFGEKRGAEAFFGIIEAGDEFANIVAFPGNKELSARVYSQFDITKKVTTPTLSVSSSESSNYYTMFEQGYYNRAIQIKYKFFSGEKADYNGMAEYYRQHLFGEKINTQPKPYPVTAEYMMGIDVNKNTLGVNVSAKFPLTTFKEAMDITDELYKKNMNVEVKLSGWMADGYKQAFINEGKLFASAGSQKDFKTFTDYLNNKSIKLFPDFDVQYVSEQTVSFFQNSRDNYSKSIQKKTAKKFEYSRITFAENPNASKLLILNDKGIIKQFDMLWKTAKSYGFKNVSLRNVGKDINSDFNKDNIRQRDMIDTLLTNKLKETKDKGYGVLINTGNVSTLQYADRILNLPIESNHYDLSSYSIPFTAMVLSGNIEYANTPINLGSSSEIDILKLIDANSGSYFLLTGDYDRETLQLNDNEYSWLYSTRYKEISNLVAIDYQKLSEALKNVYGVTIERYDILSSNVSKTTYKNGCSVITNYNNYPVKFEGKTISAFGYLAEGRS